MKSLTERLVELQTAGELELRFGTGKQATMIVELSDSRTSCLWIRSSGFVQMPRYRLREFGYSDDQITGFMDKIAEVSGAPPSKYRVQQEPQVVLPDRFSDGVVQDRLMEVLSLMSSDFRQDAAVRGSSEGDDPGLR